MKITKKLIKKAEKVFAGNDYIATGQGLTRKELRRLEIEGIVAKQLMRHDKTGQLFYRYKIIKAIDRLKIGKVQHA